MDAALWPWLPIAAMGALHGLSPLTGWGLATACSLHANDRSMPLRALLPMACGHLAAVALTAAAAVWGLSLSPYSLLAVAGGLGGVVVLARVHWPAAVWHRLRKPAGPMGMAVWSFGVATVHGAGLVLVPALAPLCGGDGAAGDAAAGGGGLSTPCCWRWPRWVFTSWPCWPSPGPRPLRPAKLCRPLSAGCSATGLAVAALSADQALAGRCRAQILLPSGSRRYARYSLPPGPSRQPGGSSQVTPPLATPAA